MLYISQCFIQVEILTDLRKEVVPRLKDSVGCHRNKRVLSDCNILHRQNYIFEVLFLGKTSVAVERS